MDIDELVDNFSLLEDWEDKYAYLISLGDVLPKMDDALKTEEVRIKGCLSKVWMILGKDDEDRISLLADSDAQIVKGLVAVIFIIINGKKTEELKSINIEEVFSKIGLDQHLTPNRRNGFFAMLERIRKFIEVGT